MTTINPVGQKLLIKPIKATEDEINGIIIPGSANAAMAKGEVAGIPNALKDVYKNGDIVLYVAQSGVGCIHKGTPHILLDGGNSLNIQGDIFAIITE